MPQCEQEFTDLDVDGCPVAHETEATAEVYVTDRDGEVQGIRLEYCDSCLREYLSDFDPAGELQPGWELHVWYHGKGE